MEKLNSDVEYFFIKNNIELGSMSMYAGQILVNAIYEDIEQLYDLYNNKIEFEKGYNECIENIKDFEKGLKV